MKIMYYEYGKISKEQLYRLSKPFREACEAEGEQCLIIPKNLIEISEKVSDAELIKISQCIKEELIHRNDKRVLEELVPQLKQLDYVIAVYQDRMYSSGGTSVSLVCEVSEGIGQFDLETYDMVSDFEKEHNLDLRIMSIEHSKFPTDKSSLIKL